MRAMTIAAPALAALAACSPGTTEGGGGGSQRSYQVGAFDSVALQGSHDVNVAVGGAPSVRAEGDPARLDRLEIEVDGSELRIRSRGRRWFSSGGSGGSVVVHVTVPSLRSASIGGSGDMRIDRIEGERFAATVAGSGDMEIGAVRVGELRVSVAGSGEVRAAGTARRSEISVAGSGDIDLGRVEAAQAQVSVVGSGDVRARATESAEVSVTGSGDVAISGTDRCTVRRLGSGEVRCSP